jgi:hypothetical protein
MSYQLTLTQSERHAFDWVGDRYCAGDVSRLLLTKCQRQPDIAEWDDTEDITFLVPEHVAWQIRDLAEEEEFLWPCFAPELTNKLNEFCFNIV